MNKNRDSSDCSLENDWERSIELNRWFLRPIGAWPLSLCVNTSEKIISMVLSTLSCALISFLLVPCALCIFLEKEGDFEAKLKAVGPLSFCMMAAAKYFILISRGEDIGRCVRHVRSDWTRTRRRDNRVDHEIMIESAKFGRSLAKFCAGFMYSGGFFYTTLMPLFSRKMEIVGNQTVRAHAFPIYRGLLDPRTSPFIEIVQLTQCFAGFVVYSVTISACSLAAVFVVHACGQFKILMSKLDDLVDGSNRKEATDSTEKRLADIVEYHLRILGFILQIEKLLREICFVELVGCTLNICFLGYYMLTEWKQNEAIGSLTYCTLLISFTFNIFILCYIGEILAEQCRNVGMATYMIDWYRLPGNKALGLSLIMAMSNSSIKLTAGKFVQLSLASFCSVIKSSLAYLSLLRTLTD